MAGKRLSKDLKTAATLQRRKQILQLRLAGASYAQISEQIGITRQAAHTHVKLALADIPVEEADEYRKVHLEQTKALLLGLWPKATRGDTASCDAVLRVLKRQASLLGLDAKQKVELEMTGLADLLGSMFDDAEGSKDGGAESAPSLET